MASNTMVTFEIDASKELLAALDEANLGVYCAYWMFAEESGLWFLHIGAIAFDMLRRHDAYLRIFDTIAALESNHIALSSITVVTRTDHIVQLLGRFARVSGISNVTFTGNVVDGVPIPDCVVLRMDLASVAPPVGPPTRRSIPPTQRTGLVAARPKSKRKR